MLTKLIAAPSVSSISPQWDQSNKLVIAHLEEWLQALDFRVEVLPIKGYKDKFNLIASTGTGPNGLVLAGHTDTVPCDPHLACAGDCWEGPSDRQDMLRDRHTPAYASRAQRYPADTSSTCL